MQEDQALLELRTIYEAISDAFRRKDLDAVLSYISRDWSGAVAGLRVTRGQLVASLRSQFSTMHDMEWDRILRNLRLNGDKATVLAHGVFRGTLIASGEPVAMDLSNDDTWLHGPSGWRCVRSVSR